MELEEEDVGHNDVELQVRTRWRKIVVDS